MTAEDAIANSTFSPPQAARRSTQDTRCGGLGGLERGELKRMFASLPPAEINETVGEFQAQLLDQGTPVAEALIQGAFNLHGPWLGKAFRPTETLGNAANVGEGYNIFGSEQVRSRKISMDTYMGDSRIARGRSMILDYSARNRGLLRWLVGEVRRLDDRTLLGMGVFGPRKQQSPRFKRIIPFVLTGPIDVYQFVAFSRVQSDDSRVSNPCRI